MAEHKEQKIMVFTELDQNDQGLIRHGIKLAFVFKKELCLVYNLAKPKSKKAPHAKQQIVAYANLVKKEIPALRVSTMVLSEHRSLLPNVLAERHEGIILVANALNFRKYTAMLSESPVPMLFVHPQSTIDSYKQLVQTLDLRKENSDASLWCSYFGRFNTAEVVIVAASDKTKEAKQAIAKNVLLTKKLYEKFNIQHKVYKGTGSSFRNAYEALELALASNCDLFVMLGSSGITPLDYLVGLPERKIMKRAGKLPVMIINPRRDNYILCD